MVDPERWYQTFKRALLYAVIIGTAWGLLASCASAPKRTVGPCVVIESGELCCNDDFRPCPGPPREIDENGCYYDGCNTCCQVRDTNMWTCTLIACVDSIPGEEDDG